MRFIAVTLVHKDWEQGKSASLVLFKENKITALAPLISNYSAVFFV